ncbi:hypothetical protein [Nakamurella aerolata]|uniref:Uncharacterized protein n=1 Tax=Nakamurella aerolata TaxID=1656892 RepID=A0A849A1L8_9ACTN|nr:hypothetical protein [Nakamurella aerolata]NNG34934.1 hypothetical protein [Nakamurella aerolata]
MSDAIDSLVIDLRRSLPTLSWRARRSLLHEIEADLRDAQAAYLAAGSSAASTASRAVADFGDPGVVVAELTTEFGARVVRWIGAAQAAVAVLMFVSWMAVGLATKGAERAAPDWGWMCLAFVAGTLPTVLLGLLARRRLGAVTLAPEVVRRWGRGVVAGVLLGMALTHGATRLKSGVAQIAPQPGDAVLGVASDWAAIALLAAAGYVAFVVHRLGRGTAPRQDVHRTPAPMPGATPVRSA